MMNPTGKNPVKITDVTFRDGHQSIFATRMTTADMAAIAPEMNRIGFPFNGGLGRRDLRCRHPFP